MSPACSWGSEWARTQHSGAELDRRQVYSVQSLKLRAEGAPGHQTEPQLNPKYPGVGGIRIDNLGSPINVSMAVMITVPALTQWDPDWRGTWKWESREPLSSVIGI